jgi:hypothetical protein
MYIYLRAVGEIKIKKKCKFIQIFNFDSLLLICQTRASHKCVKFAADKPLYKIEKNILVYFLNIISAGFVKGTVSRDFRPSVFSSNNTPRAPDSQAKAFLNSASNSPMYDRFSNAKIVHAVS